MNWGEKGRERRNANVQERKRNVSADVPPIINAVERATGVTEMEIRSPKRNARIADARHLVWYVLYKRKHQRGHIAQEFGAHHSSVTVALQKISTNRTHPKFASRIQRIKEILKGE